MKKWLLKVAWKMVKKTWKATYASVVINGDDVHIEVKVGEQEMVKKTIDMLGDGVVAMKTNED